MLRRAVFVLVLLLDSVAPPPWPRPLAVFKKHGHGQALLFPGVGGATRPYGLGPARAWRPSHLVIDAVLVGSAASMPRPSEEGAGDLLQGLCYARMLHVRRDRPPGVPAALGP